MSSFRWRGILAAMVIGSSGAWSTPASAGAPPPAAQAIIDRYVEATGGRAALDADTVRHEKGRQHEDGLDGRYEQWLQLPNRFVRMESRGTTRVRLGFDGASGWRSDLTSKQISPLEGADLIALKGGLWFEAEHWARGDSTARILVGSRGFTQGRSLQSLDITPPVGGRKQLWFDDKTGLLARITHYRDQHAWNEEVSGWRTVAGRKRATVHTMGDSLFPASFSRTILDSLFRRGPADPADFSPPNSDLKPIRWLKAKGLASFPFRYWGGHVWLKASVNGSPVSDFILDTGCTSTALDAGWARNVGLVSEGSMAAQGIGGIGTGGFVNVRTLRVVGANGDGVEIRDLKALSLELQEELSSEEWHRMSGLLGYDFLARFVVELDFDRQMVTLFDPATFRYAGAGRAVPMTLFANIPTVDVLVNESCRGSFIVDVGNATVMQLHTKQVEACGLIAQRKGKQVRHWVGGIGGAIPETVCRLDSVRIGPFGWSEPVAGLTMVRHGISGSHEVQGNLGTSVLERFKCTFDYAHGTLWLEPGSKYPARDGFTRSGLHVTRWAGVVAVVGVVKDSPAEVAGLKVRDVIRAIDGRPIERWRPEDIEYLLEKGDAGRTVTLTIERELVPRDVEVVLEDVL